MQVEDWHYCFLCLNEIASSTGENAQQRNRKMGGLDVVFRYLLDTRNETHEHVLQELLQALVSSQEMHSLNKALKFCDECQDKMEQVVKMHLQLEVVQMKIIDGLKKIKETVIVNSKTHGSNDVARQKLELYEEWLAENERKDTMAPPIERKILNLLNAFQTTIYEKDKYSQDVPCVMLKRYSLKAPMVRSPHANHVSQMATDSENNHVVKMEPLDNANVELIIPSSEFPDDTSRVSEDCRLDDAVSDEEQYSCLDIYPPKKRIKIQNKSASTTMKFKISEDNPKRRGKRSRESIVKSEPFTIEAQADHSMETTDHLLDTDQKVFGRTSRSAAAAASYRIAQIQDAETDKFNSGQKKTFLKQTASMDVKQDKTNSVHTLPVLKTRKRICTKNKIVESKTRRKLLPFATKSGEKGVRKTGNRTMYFCQTQNCPFTTISAFKFEQHLRDHETDEKNYTCNECVRSFSGKQHYDFHKALHDGYNKIRCDICNKNTLATQLVDHMKTHQEKVFPCPNCSHCSTNREKYLVHLREHGTKGKCWCDLCDLIFRSRHKLLSHLFDVHKAIDKSICDVGDCRKGFVDPENLKLHKKIHTQPYECPTCSKKFIDGSRLKAHQLLHTKEKPYKCDLCTESFINKTCLQSHLIRSHDAEKFKCEICSKEYTTKSILLSHLAVHDGTGIPCKFPGCGKVYGNKTLWRAHQATHSAEKNHICEECGKPFKTSSKLARHAVTHLIDRNFKCNYCDKAFVSKRYLDTHLQIHTGDKSYVCDICGKAFNQYAALYQHKRKHLGSAALPVNPEMGRPRVQKLPLDKKMPALFAGYFN